MFPLNLCPREPMLLAADPQNTSSSVADGAGCGDSSTRLLAAHKGKLAVGAAAMLGLAIFYRWRESRLAKEDPQQYAQLQRIKSAVAQATQAPPDEQKAQDEQ